jgi:hypothetical protein
MNSSVQGSFQMLTVAVHDDPNDPANQGNQSTKEDDRKQVNIMLRLHTCNTNHRRIGSHHGLAPHNTKYHHENSGEQAENFAQLTKSTNRSRQTVAVLIAGGGLRAMVYESCSRCCHPASGISQKFTKYKRKSRDLWRSGPCRSGFTSPDRAAKFHSKGNRHRFRQPRAGTEDSSGSARGCSEGRS